MLQEYYQLSEILRQFMTFLEHLVEGDIHPYPGHSHDPDEYGVCKICNWVPEEAVCPNCDISLRTHLYLVLEDLDVVISELEDPSTTELSEDATSRMLNIIEYMMKYGFATKAEPIIEGSPFPDMRTVYYN